jgi:hypothetical protein
VRKPVKRRWVLGAVLVLVIVAAGYLVVPVGEGRISQATCDKLEIGWPPEKVFPLLGEKCDLPDDDWQTRAIFREDEDGNRLLLRFERGKGLTEKSFTPTTLSFFEQVKARFERRIRALWP